MATVVWTVFAVSIMLVVFASCVIVVTLGTRILENAVLKRRLKSGG